MYFSLWPGRRIVGWDMPERRGEQSEKHPLVLNEGMGTSKVEGTASARKKEDLTGRDRLGRNVIASWGGYLVFIAAGFVMPRLIDEYVGQVSLGIWDFCWSLVHYLNVASLGVGSSVNRYVAKFRASHDVIGLGRAISSVVCIQLVIGLVVLLITALLVWCLPIFFVERLGAELDDAQWVVGLLGASVAVQMALDAFRGVMTGCHRWDIYNALNAGGYSISVFGMIAALLLGGDLRSLSAVYLVAVVMTEVVRMVLAFRICPELRIRVRDVDGSQLKEMILFGGKTVVASLPPLITVQTTSVFVAGALGPAALAVLARPVALVRHVETFIQKFSFVLTPTAGAIQGTGRDGELKQFLIDTTRYGVAFTLPMVMVLGVFGDHVLRIWMGPNYEAGTLLAILAAGYFLPVSQSPTLRILMGMNLHGRVALLNLLVIVGIYGTGAVWFSLSGWTLERACILIAVALTVGNGITIPVYACRQLNIPLNRYIREVFSVPVSCGVAFALWLMVAGWVFPGHGMGEFVLGGFVGVLLLGGLYWRWLLPESVRMRLLGKLASITGMKIRRREANGS